MCTPTPTPTPQEADREAIDILKGFVDFVEYGPGPLDEDLLNDIIKARNWLQMQEDSL